MQGSIGRGVRRRVRRAVTWRPTRLGTEPVDISGLIAPLRLDVLVRARFLDWLEPRLDSDPAVVSQHAMDQPYAAWFRHVEVARFAPIWPTTRPPWRPRTQTGWAARPPCCGPTSRTASTPGTR